MKHARIGTFPHAPTRTRMLGTGVARSIRASTQDQDGYGRNPGVTKICEEWTCPSRNMRCRRMDNADEEMTRPVEPISLGDVVIMVPMYTQGSRLPLLECSSRCLQHLRTPLRICHGNCGVREVSVVSPASRPAGSLVEGK